MSKKLKQVLNLHDRVKNYLHHYEGLRDSDEKLIAFIWRDEVERKYGNDALLKMSAYDFLKDCFIGGVISSSDSITRARRKVQENNPDLRGKLYAARQEQENKFRKGINE